MVRDDEMKFDFRPIEELMLTSEPEFNDVLRCVFKIKNHEIGLYFILLDNPESTVIELSKVLGKDRSTIQKDLKTLMEKGLVKREFRISDKSGYTYIYTAMPLDELKKLMEEEIKNWSSMMIDLVKKFEK